MINLLSSTDKKELRAARRNTIWARYTFLVLALLVAINIILGLTALFIQAQARAYEERIADNEQLSNQRYSGTKAKADTFRKELATAKTILEGETKFSTVIVNIARTIPPGCIMTGLTLNTQSFDTPQSINFECKDRSGILGLKSALEKNTVVFDKVNIVTTSIKPATTPEPYSVTISMSLVLKKPVENGKSSL